jgi:hypothetical protein
MVSEPQVRRIFSTARNSDWLSSGTQQIIVKRIIYKALGVFSKNYRLATTGRSRILFHWRAKAPPALGTTPRRHLRTVLPNTSVNRTRYGRQRKAGMQWLRHFRTPALRRLPPRAGYLER